jgi:hypothetical protein
MWFLNGNRILPQKRVAVSWNGQVVSAMFLIRKFAPYLGLHLTLSYAVRGAFVGVPPPVRTSAFVVPDRPSPPLRVPDKVTTMTVKVYCLAQRFMQFVSMSSLGVVQLKSIWHRIALTFALVLAWQIAGGPLRLSAGRKPDVTL